MFRFSASLLFALAAHQAFTALLRVAERNKWRCSQRSRKTAQTMHTALLSVAWARGWWRGVLLRSLCSCIPSTGPPQRSRAELEHILRCASRHPSTGGTIIAWWSAFALTHNVILFLPNAADVLWKGGPPKALALMLRGST